MKIPVSVIILTYNEEKNIRGCLDSIQNFADEIFIVDSYSSDNTLNIAREYTHCIYQHNFKNHSSQLNWALENLPIRNEWVMRVDSDERWTDRGIKELGRIIQIEDVDGIFIKMKIFFMGRWIRHGDFYPNYFLRVFKKSKFLIESRMMDEHVKVLGKTVSSSIDVLESNYDRQKNIALWVNKHNNYSTFEAVDFLMNKYELANLHSIAKFYGNRVERKRWLKESIYFKLPLFIRPALYFFYRYLIRFGFLDGIQGLIFHFLQGFWYRFMVDVKIYQIESRSRRESRAIADIIDEFLAAIKIC